MHFLSRIECFVFEEDNQFLTAQFTKEEVLSSVKEMGPTKALAEDGYPTIFSNSFGILWERT